MHPRHRLCIVCHMANQHLDHADGNGSGFSQRVQVRIRPDQRERVEELAGILNTDLSAIVRLAIDRMFEELEETKQREVAWQRAVRRAATS